MNQVIDQLIVEAAILEMINEEYKLPVYDKGRHKQNNAKAFYYWFKNSKGKIVGSTESNAQKRGYTPISPDDKEAKKIKSDQKPQSGEDPDQDSSSTGVDATGAANPARSDQDTADFDGSGSIVGNDPPESEKKEGDSKSDEEITKLAEELGFEKGKLPESMMKADKTILKALIKGFNKGPDWTPAPGSKTSLFNETMSMVGTQLAVELANRGIETTPEQLGKVLEGLYGNTKAWKEAAAGKPNQVKIVAEAAIQKASLIRNAADGAGIDLENAEVKNYYGTRISLENQYNEIINVGDDVELVGGRGEPITSIPTDILTVHQLMGYNDIDGNPLSKEEIKEMIKNPNDRESIKKFLALSALNGGGGGNPSDTATIISGDGKLAFLAYSDKTSLGDQQANSTPAKFVETLAETVDFLEDLGYKFDEEDKAAALKTLEEMGKSFAATERKIGETLAAPLKAISESFADDETRDAIKNIYEEQIGGQTTSKAMAIKKKLAEMQPAGKAFSIAADSTDHDISWDYYLKEAGWEEGEPTDDQKLEAFLLSRSDTRPYSYTDDEGNKVESTLGAAASSKAEIEYLGKMVKSMAISHKDPDNDFKLPENTAASVLETSANVEKLRKESLDVMTAGFAELNEHKIEDENGNQFGLGNMMGGFDLIEKLHLYMVDDKPSGLYAMDSVFIIAGDDGVSPENMKKCLGVDSTEDLLKQIKTEPPEKEGPTINYLGGEELHESEISRSGNPDELAKTKDGKLIYLVNGEYKTAPEGESVPKEYKKPLGQITGRKVLAYIQDEKGERTPIGYQTYRTKGGYNLQTTYVFSPDLQKCLGGNKIANESISCDYINAMILMEMASKV